MSRTFTVAAAVFVFLCGLAAYSDSGADVSIRVVGAVLMSLAVGIAYYVVDSAIDVVVVDERKRSGDDE